MLFWLECDYSASIGNALIWSKGLKEIWILILFLTWDNWFHSPVLLTINPAPYFKLQSSAILKWLSVYDKRKKHGKLTAPIHKALTDLLLGISPCVGLTCLCILFHSEKKEMWRNQKLLRTSTHSDRCTAALSSPATEVISTPFSPILCRPSIPISALSNVLGLPRAFVLSEERF